MLSCVVGPRCLFHTCTRPRHYTKFLRHGGPIVPLDAVKTISTDSHTFKSCVCSYMSCGENKACCIARYPIGEDDSGSFKEHFSGKLTADNDDREEDSTAV